MNIVIKIKYILLLVLVVTILGIIYIKSTESLYITTFPTGITKTYISPNKILNSCHQHPEMPGPLSLGQY